MLDRAWTGFLGAIAGAKIAIVLVAENNLTDINRWWAVLFMFALTVTVGIEARKYFRKRANG